MPLFSVGLKPKVEMGVLVADLIDKVVKIALKRGVVLVGVFIVPVFLRLKKA